MQSRSRRYGPRDPRAGADARRTTPPFIPCFARIARTLVLHVYAIRTGLQRTPHPRHCTSPLLVDGCLEARNPRGTRSLAWHPGAIRDPVLAVTETFLISCRRSHRKKRRQSAAAAGSGVRRARLYTACRAFLNDARGQMASIALVRVREASKADEAAFGRPLPTDQPEGLAGTRTVASVSEERIDLPSAGPASSRAGWRPLEVA
jgi:hypothetical protein